MGSSGRPSPPATSTATRLRTSRSACGNGANLRRVAWAAASPSCPAAPTALTGAGSSIWNQDTPGVLDTGEWQDGFGSTLAIGDFDGDGFGDLAIAAVGEALTGGPDDDDASGAVAVLYGSDAGVTADGNQRWDENTPGVPGAAEVRGPVRRVARAGDFDGDAVVDLSIGSPNKWVATKGTAGVVVVLYGSTPAGLTSTGAQRWTQASHGVPSAAEQYDEFGTSLAAADYGRSGRDDLAIGAPGESSRRRVARGMVDVLYGRTDGLTSDYAQGWSPDSPGVAGRSEQYGSFGARLVR